MDHSTRLRYNVKIYCYNKSTPLQMTKSLIEVCNLYSLIYNECLVFDNWRLNKSLNLKKSFSISCICYELVQGFWVTCFITGHYNTKDYGTITTHPGPT